MPSERQGHDAVAIAKIRFRGSEAPEHIKVLREYVAARKGLHDLLHYSGLGSHPDIVGELAERAWALRNRNQLGKSLDVERGGGSGR
jgi:hypothetical protein